MSGFWPRAAWRASIGGVLVLVWLTLFVGNANATQGDLYAAGTVYRAGTYAGHSNGKFSDYWSVDINADGGDMGRPVYAPENGTVEINTRAGVGYGTINGNSLFWTSADGTEKIYVGHLNDFVKTGAVSGGDLIAHAGATGQVTGDHMHVYRTVNGAPAPLVLSGQTINPAWEPWTYGSNGNPYTSRGPIKGGDPRYNPIAPGDSGFTKGGSASGWTSFGGGLYGTAIYTYVNNVARDNWGRWTFDLSKLNGAGYYKVEAYVTSTHAGTHNAHYDINTSSGLAYHSVDQNALSNQWADLGTYSFSPGSTWIELDDLTGEPFGTTESKQIVFDAVRLTPVAPAQLSVVGAVSLSPGPYIVGKKVTATFTVKNTGGQPGTWTPLIMAFRGPSGQNRDALAASSITLAPGQSQTVNCSRTIDLVGNWTGFVSGKFGGTSWQRPGGATVSFRSRKISRIYGDDRYGTSVAISKRAFKPGVPAVVIASGEAFPDALAAAPLARAYRGPVLLTTARSLPETVTAELKRLAPAKVFIVGGTSSVSAGVESAIAKMAWRPTVKRFWGSDRYDTAGLVADAVKARLGTVTKVVLVNGLAFPDAVLASPVAAVKGWPVLLTSGTSLNGRTKAAITRLRPTSTLVVGDKTDIPDAAAAGLPSTYRLANTDHYANGVAMMSYAKGQGLAIRHVALATGLKFADALSAAPYLSTDSGVVLLTQPTSLPAQVQNALSANGANLNTLDVIGSSVSVSDGVMSKAIGLLH